MSEDRPAHDDVLARFKQTPVAGLGSAGGVPDGGGASAPRGRLKVFFGMSPGVGKTYAMLASAQRLAGQGVDVVVGVVETHGRAETEQLLLGLDVLARRSVEYEGVTLTEFDAEAAMLRRPDLVLVDELAHSNAPGSKRAKRWQDVEECLKAGVNVHTTLNVQHLESLNDVVAQVTGVRVTETVPDRVIDEADEVELVDLAPDALHERLRAGKVYGAENAARAIDPADGFFRKGNLAALRELALRRTAAWVDSDLRRYKRDHGIRALWPTGERVVVAVSASPMAGRVVRAAKRMAAGLHAELIAVHVESARSNTLSGVDRERLHETMRLAERLGATTATLAGQNAAAEIIAFARARNVGRIVVGKTEQPRWRDVVFGSFIDQLIRASADIEISVVRGDESSAAGSRAARADEVPRGRGAARRAGELALTTLVVGACAGIGLLFFRPPDLSEEALVLLGGIVVAALSFGRLAAVLASVLSVLVFNFLFTEPRFSFHVNDPGAVLTFGVMLLVGLVVGTLAARSREQTLRSWARERTTGAQFALARELGAARDAPAVARVLTRHAHDLLHADAVVCAPARADAAPGAPLAVLASAGVPDWFDDGAGRERGVARWALDHGQAAGEGTGRLPGSAGRYVPLIGTGGIVGVLGLRAREGAGLDAAGSEALDALVSQGASALERVSLGEAQQAARLEAERERLRSALLSSVSHDLRTPLASITGAASALELAATGGGSIDRTDAGTIDPETERALLRTIVDESSRLNDIIANLVFATRLESGAVSLRREWTTVEEIVGVGLARHRAALAGRSLRVAIAPDLPMLCVDNAMLPQVVHNFVENALRYSPAGTAMGIGAWAAGGLVTVKVWDEGPGLAEDETARVFERFYRGRASRGASAAAATGAGNGGGSASGMGLGLSICEGVVRAHGGRIWAEPNVPRGVAFCFSLPIEHPQPTLPHEHADQEGSPA